MDAIIGLFRCLPCIPSGASTPNLDQLQEVYNKFKTDNPDTNLSILDRVDSNSLCDWSQKILDLLPALDKSDKTTQFVSHFGTIKKFYAAVRDLGADPGADVKAFMNILQIYEAIGDQIEKAIGKLSEAIESGICSLVCGVCALMSRFNEILTEIDRILGDIGIVKIVQFVVNVIEFFCKFFNLKIFDSNTLATIGKSVQDMIGGVGGAFASIFGNHIPQMQRSKKWGVLDVTSKIRSATGKFESRSPIVSRMCSSFDRLFGNVEKIDYHCQSQPQLSRSSDDQGSVLSHINLIGKFFQSLETVLSYGVLIFSNEESVLNPVLDQIDACSDTLEKYLNLHILYKILLGPSYLSKLQKNCSRILDLFANSNLKINSPQDFLNEVKDKYPELLKLICETMGDDLRQKLDILPNNINNAFNGAFNGALNRFHL